MTVRGKEFDQNLYDRFNDFGILIAIDFFRQYGFDLVRTTNQYGVDCSFYDSRYNNFRNVEVEVRQKEHWDLSGFKYPTLTIPCRKEKFVIKHGLYVSISEIGHELFIVGFDKVYGSRIVFKKNIYNQHQEEFYDVSLDDCKLMRNVKGIWRRMK